MSRNASASSTSSSRAAVRAWLAERGIAALVRNGLRGVEKESLRVSSDGRLSLRPHPRALGAALTHPYLTTDYSEALPEFVTPPLPTNWQTLQFLFDLHAFAERRLDGELLWPASMPCELPAEEDIPIAYYGPSNPGLMKTVYRRGLGYRYGRAMQAIAGVHFNFSVPADFWPAFREREGGSESLADFRSARFMGLVRNYRRHAWVVTYLFGASPALCRSFRPEGHPLLSALDSATWHAPFATSLRMSDLGYRNKTQARLAISSNSLQEYVAALGGAITTEEPRYSAIGVVVDGEYRQLNANILQIENEYYSPIRPKPSKRSSARPIVALRTDGVEYVEIRTLDLNPFDPVGINQNELRFIEALLVHCLLEDAPPITAEEQREIDARDLAVAREGRRPGLAIPAGGRERSVAAWGAEICTELGAIATLLDERREGYLAATTEAAMAFREPERTPSARLLAELRQRRASFFEYSLELARDHHEYFLAMRQDGDEERRLEQAAAESLAEAEALERRPAEPFADYLRRYFASV